MLEPSISLPEVASTRQGSGAAAVAARGLRRTFDDEIEAVRGIDLDSRAARCSASSAPTAPARRRPCACSAPCCRPAAARRPSPAMTSSPRPSEVRPRIGVALQEIGLDPVQTGRELLELQCGLYGILGAAGRERTDELLELMGLAEAADRRDQDLLRRHEAPPRPGQRARPPARGPLPRRADDGARPRLAADGMGGAAADQRRAARRSSSPPSTWRRPTSSATGSRSSTRARSSPRARPER